MPDAIAVGVEDAMGGRTISAWVEDTVARDAETLARMEARPPAHIIAAAVRLYLNLPEEAHTALRKIEAFGTEDEIRWAMRRVARALLDAQWEIASQRAAEQMRVEDADSAVTEAEALRLTQGA